MVRTESDKDPIFRSQMNTVQAGPYSAGGYLFRKFARGAWLRRHCHFPKFSAKCQACDLPRNFTILIASPDGRVCLAIVLTRIEVLPVSLAVEPITNVIGQRAKHANRQRSPYCPQQQDRIHAFDQIFID